MIRSILYATDLGIYAPVVMQHALGMARSFNADLFVVHVVEPMGLFAESVLQSYLDKQALSELHQQGMSTMLSNIELRVFERQRPPVTLVHAGPDRLLPDAASFVSDRGSENSSFAA